MTDNPEAQSDTKALDALARALHKHDVRYERKEVWNEGYAVIYGNWAKGIADNLAALGYSLVPTATLDALRDNAAHSAWLAFESSRAPAVLLAALEAIKALPTVVPDHPHGGVHPPYLAWADVAKLVDAALAALPAEQPATPETDEYPEGCTCYSDDDYFGEACPLHGPASVPAPEDTETEGEAQ